MKVVADTNILIDYLNGLSKAKKELELYEEVHISIISWMEALIGARSEEEEKIIRGFLKTLKVQEVNSPISERAIKIRKEKKIKLPDAIIWATAQELEGLLITRNTKDFPKKDPQIRVPYVIT